MTSLRRLRRRLLRWERYAAKTGHESPRMGRSFSRWSNPASWLRGHCRAFDAVEIEVERRFWDETPEIWLGGPEGESALIADVLGDRYAAGHDEPNYNCCRAGEEDHPGPCVVPCLDCNGDGRCPNCGGIDDMGCGECGGNGACPAGCDEGEEVVLW